MTETKTVLTSGWSPYYHGSKGGTRKYHYFPNGEGASICGHVTLSEDNRKHKFLDLSANYNPKKFCHHCKKYGVPIK